MNLRKLRVALGVVLIVAAVVVFWNKRIPVYEHITLNVIGAQDTPVLMPGDCLTQDMYISYDNIEKISIAFSYQEGIAEETEALIELIAEGETVMSQSLYVNACANQSFVDFEVNLDKCEGKTITISVSNVTSEAVPGGEFALMSTDKEYLFLDEVSTYRINGGETDSCIFCRAVCLQGYEYYKALTWAFLVFLAGGVLIERLTGNRRGKQ